jgi:hypothetical protein
LRQSLQHGGNVVDTSCWGVPEAGSRDGDGPADDMGGWRRPQDAIDPEDEGYVVQKKVAGEDEVISALMQFLEDDSDAVKTEAANAIAALTRHSQAALDRMSHLTGVSNVDVMKVQVRCSLP